MKEIYIFIFIFLVTIIFLRNKYYDLYVNEPYITVHAKSGLSNKIRVILSYLYRANKEEKKLKVIWLVDDECPEIYSNLFEPIENMSVIPINTNYDYTTWEPDNIDYINNKYLTLLKPLPQIQSIIDSNKNKLGNKYISCHIRRTDALSHPVHKIKSEKEYMDFIDNYDLNMKIYIATDNKETQDIFLDKYGDRLILKKIIQSEKLRQTSVQDALIDIYTCVGAEYFMGSNGSSFTDLINQFRNDK
jgi:hypothetical protein